MCILVDTDVWVLAEKSGGTLSLARWAAYGGAYMSAITASELLVGVERANTAPRHAARFVVPLSKTCYPLFLL
jgi:tRNA(fMet)-specific endonuclease VapC